MCHHAVTSEQFLLHSAVLISTQEFVKGSSAYAQVLLQWRKKGAGGAGAAPLPNNIISGVGAQPHPLPPIFMKLTT